MRSTIAFQLSLANMRDILSSDYRGPRVGFSEAQVIKAILEIGEKGAIGRTKLGTLLDLGQGEIRTLIKRLKDVGVISVEQNGCELTDSGRVEFNLIVSSFQWRSFVDGASLGIGKYCFAIIARGAAKKVKMGIEQRDAAIKAGASGALTVFYTKEKFLIPNEGTDCEKTTGSREPWRSIRFGKPKEGDAVIISGADAELVAEYGAWNAATTLFSDK